MLKNCGGFYNVQNTKNLSKNKFCSLYEYKIEQSEYDFLKQAFFGGVTILNLAKMNEIIPEALYDDIKSSYPYIMKNYKLPQRKPLKITCDTNINCENNGFGHFTIYKIIIDWVLPKKDTPMMIQHPCGKHNSKHYIYPHKNTYKINLRSNERYLSYPDLLLFEKIHYGKWTKEKIMCFETDFSPHFSTTIETLYNLKNEAELNKNYSLRTAIKIIINCLYGKNAEGYYDNVHGLTENLEKISQYSDKKFENLVEKYLPIAIAITS